MITVTLYGTRDEKILDDCFSLAGNYEKKLSNTITDSEVSKINRIAKRPVCDNQQRYPLPDPKMVSGMEKSVMEH